jgi:hypothetical protein
VVISTFHPDDVHCAESDAVGGHSYAGDVQLSPTCAHGAPIAGASNGHASASTGSSFAVGKQPSGFQSLPMHVVQSRRVPVHHPCTRRRRTCTSARELRMRQSAPTKDRANPLRNRLRSGSRRSRRTRARRKRRKKTARARPRTTGSCSTLSNRRARRAPRFSLLPLAGAHTSHRARAQGPAALRGGSERALKPRHHSKTRRTPEAKRGCRGPARGLRTKRSEAQSVTELRSEAERTGFEGSSLRPLTRPRQAPP